MRSRTPKNPHKHPSVSCDGVFYPTRDSFGEKHRQLSDKDFTRLFEEGTLEPDVFTHEAHLRLAWLLIKEHGLQLATEMLCSQIMHFDRQHGKGTKFNKVITLAAAQLVDDLQRQSHDRSFMDFIGRHPRLFSDFGTLLAPYMANLGDGV